MRRLLLASLLPALALGAPAPALASGPMSVRSTCRTGPADSDRSIRVETTVRALPRARRVRLQYDLQWRPAGARGFRHYPIAPFVRRVVAPTVHDYTVTPLPPRAVYRVRVRARWTSPRGRVILRAQRMTAECRQRDRRPDLRPVVFSRRDGRVAVWVRNAGPTAAGPFVVTAAGRQVAVDGLAPGARRRMAILAACSGPVDVDAQNTVDERDEANNARALPCRTG